jgi:dGTPase
MKRFDQSLFEGNAQSFRVVTFTETKDAGLSASDSDRWVGLNLTRTTLRALCKYPWSETEHAKHGTHGKFNVYNDPLDLEYFAWVWNQGAPERTLSAQIMDASDDIAYAAHDFEDGVWAGMIPLHDLVSGYPDALRRLQDKVLERDENREERAFPDGKIESSLEGLLSGAKDKYWARRPFDRSRRSRKDLKKFTADLIHYFIENVTDGEKFNAPSGEVLRRLDLLTGMAWVWMIERSDLATWKYGQEKLIGELFEGYWKKPEMLPQRDEWRTVEETSSEVEGKWPEKARFIRDHIAGMTDAYAKEVHREMHGAVQTIDLGLTY